LISEADGDVEASGKTVGMKTDEENIITIEE
jgi:hypothetical protein